MAIISISNFVDEEKKKKRLNPVADMLTGKVPLEEVSGGKPKIVSIKNFLDSKGKVPQKVPEQSILQKFNNSTVGQIPDTILGGGAELLRAGFRATAGAVQTIANSNIGRKIISQSPSAELLGLGDGNRKVYDPNATGASKILQEEIFGKDPGTAETQGQETLSILKNGETNFWKDPLGYSLNKVSENLSKNKNAASAVGFLTAGLDFTGAGKVDDTLKVLTKVDDVAKAATELKKIGVIDELIPKYAVEIAGTKSEKRIQTILDAIQEEQKVNPLSGIKRFPEEAKKKIVTNVEALKPEFEKLKGGKLTNQEVIDAANTSTIMPKVITREQTKANLAAIQKTKQNLAALAEGNDVSKDFIEQIRIIKSQATDAGRKLQSFQTEVNPLLATKADIIGKLTDLGIETDKILAAAKNVDFSDAKQVTNFYREFVKPTYGELLDEWRYGNLLSSPKTHIINAVSNAMQAAVLNPATKLASGLVDNVARVFGKEQENYIKEVPVYVRGLANSLGDAVSEGYKALRGGNAATNLDLNRIPTNSKLTIVQRQFLQALEAGDAFFRALVKGGEREALAFKYQQQGKKFTAESLEEEVAKRAEYFVFRKPLDISNKTGQGTLLTGIDKITNGVMKMRDNKFMGWLVPFVQTPMNILKQGIEYSPLGVLTLPKNANKVEQLGKTLVGATVFAFAGEMALHDRTTWAAPTNPKEKDLFYASGMQPYSVKIGDKWFSYSKIGPLAYPMAMAAAIKYYWKDNPDAQTATTTEKTLEIVGGIAKFFGDQSYVQGISEAVGLLSGETRGESIIKTFENLAGQAIPLVSLQRWVNQMIDPVFRKTPHEANIQTILKNLQAQLLTQSDVQEPYTTPDGKPSLRQYPFINALNPFNVTSENPDFAEQLTGNRKIQALNKLKTKAQEEDKARLEPVYQHVTELEKAGKMEEAQAIKDGLSDDDWETFKNIRESNQEAEVKKLQPEMLDVYKQVSDLRAENPNDDQSGVQEILDGLTDDQYKAYKQVEKLAEGAGGVENVNLDNFKAKDENARQTLREAQHYLAQVRGQYVDPGTGATKISQAPKESWTDKLTAKFWINKAIEAIKEEVPFFENKWGKRLKTEAFDEYNFTDNAKTLFNKEAIIRDVSPEFDKALNLYKVDGQLSTENPREWAGLHQRDALPLTDKSSISVADNGIDTVAHELLHNYVENTDFNARAFNDAWMEVKQGRTGYEWEYNGALEAIDDLLKSDTLYDKNGAYGTANERFAYLGETFGRGGLQELPPELRPFYQGVFKENLGKD